jgi:hypothetical protein
LDDESDDWLMLLLLDELGAPNSQLDFHKLSTDPAGGWGPGNAWVSSMARGGLGAAETLASLRGAAAGNRSSSAPGGSHGCGVDWGAGLVDQDGVIPSTVSRSPAVSA